MSIVRLLRFLIFFHRVLSSILQSVLSSSRRRLNFLHTCTRLDLQWAESECRCFRFRDLEHVFAITASRTRLSHYRWTHTSLSFINCQRLLLSWRPNLTCHCFRRCFQLRFFRFFCFLWFRLLNFLSFVLVHNKATDEAKTTKTNSVQQTPSHRWSSANSSFPFRLRLRLDHLPSLQAVPLLISQLICLPFAQSIDDFGLTTGRFPNCANCRG